MGYIYILKNKINGKIYIGQTVRPIKTRLGEHRSGRSANCRLIYRAIKFHGWDNFEKDWYECPDEDLDFDEELLIKEMKTLSPEGYNLKEGGGNGKLSEETKQKLSGENHPMWGKQHSEETKQKMSESKQGEKNHMYGKTHTEESKRKLREIQLGEKNNMWGKTPSEETKQKQREANLGEKNHMFGKTHSEESRQKNRDAHLGENNHKSKRVYQYALDDTFINSFESSGEASRYLKKNGTNIRECARGIRKTAHGYKWSYIKI